MAVPVVLLADPAAVVHYTGENSAREAYKSYPDDTWSTAEEPHSTSCKFDTSYGQPVPDKTLMAT